MARSDSLSVRMQHAAAHAAAHGLAWTPLRAQVYEAVLNAGRPIGAYDLLAALEPLVGRRMPPTSVYRVLDLLVEHDLIHRIESKNAFVACCDVGQPHQSQFLICERCGETVEIPGSELAHSLSSSENAHGFELHRQVVELTGLCARCRAETPR